MGKLGQYYRSIKLDLELLAADNGGVVTKKQLRRLIVERLELLDPRTHSNLIEALVATGKLKPVNQNAYLFCDGKEGSE